MCQVEMGSRPAYKLIGIILMEMSTRSKKPVSFIFAPFIFILVENHSNELEAKLAGHRHFYHDSNVIRSTGRNTGSGYI